MEGCKPVSTPMVIGCKLSKDDHFRETNQSWYRSMIGILFYVTTFRAYIMQAVGMVERFQSAPKETHVHVVKRICWYLKGTLDFGLWYPRNNGFSFTTYFDVDWARCVDDRKITNGCAFFLVDFLVSWLSRNQASISLSTTEVEYIAAVYLYTQIMWMKHTL